MKLIFQDLKDSLLNLMRRAGYGFERKDFKTGEDNYTRRLSSGADYPRFHAFAKKEGNDLIVNLHLDQKKASYGEWTAHSGEYQDSEILQKEAERIKETVNQVSK